MSLARLKNNFRKRGCLLRNPVEYIHAQAVKNGKLKNACQYELSHALGVWPTQWMRNTNPVAIIVGMIPALNIAMSLFRDATVILSTNFVLYDAIKKLNVNCFKNAKLA
jgi:hypothetical protein